MNTYDKGDLVRLTATFSDNESEAVDPDTVVCKVKDPTGSVSIYTYNADEELVRDSAGTFHLDVSVDFPGEYFYRFHSTGNGQAASESSFKVSSSAF